MSVSAAARTLFMRAVQLPERVGSAVGIGAAHGGNSGAVQRKRKALPKDRLRQLERLLASRLNHFGAKPVPDHVCERLGAKFLHSHNAMRFHCLDTDPQQRCDRLVGRGRQHEKSGQIPD
jgi:hypothetical protein